MGDIDEQTLAGATSTGTHGTGGVAASLSAQLAGLELVTGDGSVLRASRDENADVFAAARVGLGALGVLTSLTFQVEPLGVLEAHERPMAWDDALAAYDDLLAAQPPRRHVLVPAHRRGPGEDQQPARRRPVRGRAAVAVAGLAGGRAALQHRLRRDERGSATASRRWCRGSPGWPAGCSPSAATPTSRTGSSPRRGGWSSGRWSTPSRVRPG